MNSASASASAISRTESSSGAIAAYLALQLAASRAFDRAEHLAAARMAADAARAHTLCMSAIGTRSRDYSRRME